MATQYANQITAQDIADMTGYDSKVKGELYGKYLERCAGQHNAFKFFTSQVDANGRAGGVRSIFAEKTDLAAGGADTINFQVVGPPGGPGALGNQELVSRLSVAKVASYPVRVGWQRDGFALTKDQIEFLAAGRNLQVTVLDLLSQKMDIYKQNSQMMRLITAAKAAGSNVFRPKNKTSLNALRYGDTMSLSLATAGRARARTLGAQPLFHKVSDVGSPIDGYLVFASDAAMLAIRNTDAFNTAVQLADTRGPENSMFTGELLKWQGMPWYEMPVIDQPWDDYQGLPILAKAKLGYAVGRTTYSGTTDSELLVNKSNTLSQYFQFFEGYDYKFTEDQGAAPDSTVYYAWVINPNGSLGFISYVGSDNTGNKIIINKILSPHANTHNASNTGAGALVATTVGDLTINTTDTWTGGAATLPASSADYGTWTYTDEFVADAVVIPANSHGVPFGRSFVFGAMSSCYANGRVVLNQVEQLVDFGFVTAKGYEMIFGTGVTHNANKKPVGYLMVEHAITHEGYPVPVIA